MSSFFQIYILSYSKDIYLSLTSIFPLIFISQFFFHAHSSFHFDFFFCNKRKDSILFWNKVWRNKNSIQIKLEIRFKWCQPCQWIRVPLPCVPTQHLWQWRLDHNLVSCVVTSGSVFFFGLHVIKIKIRMVYALRICGHKQGKLCSTHETFVGIETP